MAKKMLFIFNPKAGKGLIKNKLLEIIDIFTKDDYHVLAYPTQSQGDAITKTKEIGEGMDLVVCSGGDGTLDEVVSGLRQGGRMVPIGYIPAGSTNDFASSLNLSRDFIEAAQEIVKGEPYSCDVGSFNKDTFVYVAAFGVFTDVSYSTNQDLKNILGHLAYVFEGVKKLSSIKSYWIRADNNGQVFEGEYIFGMITNSNSIGGFKNLIGQDVSLNDGLFEVTMIKKPKNPLEWQEVITCLLTQIDNSDLIDSFKTNRLIIEAREEIPWTLDGEFGGEHSFARIEAIKNGFDIMILPAKQGKEKEKKETLAFPYCE